MRKIVFALLMLLNLSISAQEIVKFMGIPIDGNKTEMISQLKEHGFTYDEEQDCLHGTFNGELVDANIYTYNNRVGRIKVSLAKSVNEIEVKVKYNKLLKYFNNNNRYRKKEGGLIDYNTNIRNGLDEGRSFKSSFEERYTNEEFIELKKIVHDNYDELLAYYLDQSSLLDANGDREKNETVIALIYSLYYSKNEIWFFISESKEKSDLYNIILVFDNLNIIPQRSSEETIDGSNIAPAYMLEYYYNGY